jgi:hypothetical protein
MSGGAIKQGAGTAMLFVRTSTFYQCDESYAGAIAAYGGSFEATRCCFVECTASYSGHAIEIDYDAGVRRIVECSFRACGKSNVKGLIYCRKTATFSIEYANVTGTTTGSGVGAVIAMESDVGAAEWYAQYCTIVGCSAANAFDSYSTADNVIELCNIFDNTFSSTIVHVNAFGVIVGYCVFRGNSPTVPLTMTTPSAGNGFRVIGSVFDCPVPAGSIFYERLDDTWQTITASMVLSHMATYLCPTNSPTRSASLAITPWPSPSPPLSRSPLPSVTVSSSLHPTSSPAPTLSTSATPFATKSFSCSLILTQTTRQRWTLNACVYVQYCFFNRLESREDAIVSGGAIDQENGDMFLSASTFLSCSATYGGAVLANGFSGELMRCCFRHCSAYSEGMAVATLGGTPALSIAFSNFVENVREGGKGDGLISHGTSTLAAMLSLNISGTDTPKAYGGAFINAGFVARWRLSFSTVWNCTAANVIESVQTQVNPYVGFCNFYNSTASDALVYAREWGLAMESCIFRGNTGPLFLVHLPSPLTGFRFANCVLDTGFPPAAIVAFVTNLQVNLATESQFLGHFSTFYCPAVTPTRSISASPAASNTAPKTATCLKLNGVTTRIISADAVCTVISDSFFANLAAGSAVGERSGGAICQSNGAGPFYVSDCTCYICTAQYGGAIGIYGKSMAVARCCVRQCSAAMQGLAVEDYADPESESFELCSFVACASGEGRGLIFHFLACEFVLSHANVTGTMTEGRSGACINAQNEYSLWSMSYATVLGCTAANTIESAVSTVRQAVQMCNFYGNTVTDGVIRVSLLGMQMSSCIFRGNTAGKALAAPGMNLDLGKRFVLSDCVFDDVLPASLVETLDVAENSVTESWDLANFATELCPTPSLPATKSRPASQSKAPFPSHSPEPTEAQNPQPTESISPVTTETDSPHPSGTASPLPSVTDSPFPTVIDSPFPTVTDSPHSSGTDSPFPSTTLSKSLPATDEFTFNVGIRHRKQIIFRGVLGMFISWNF